MSKFRCTETNQKDIFYMPDSVEQTKPELPVLSHPSLCCCFGSMGILLSIRARSQGSGSGAAPTFTFLSIRAWSQGSGSGAARMFIFWSVEHGARGLAVALHMRLLDVCRSCCLLSSAGKVIEVWNRLSFEVFELSFDK